MRRRVRAGLRRVRRGFDPRRQPMSDASLPARASLRCPGITIMKGRPMRPLSRTPRRRCHWRAGRHPRRHPGLGGAHPAPEPAEAASGCRRGDPAPRRQDRRRRLCRIPVKAANVRLLGKSGTAYIVGTSDRNGSARRVLPPRGQRHLHRPRQDQRLRDRAVRRRPDRRLVPGIRRRKTRSRRARPRPGHHRQAAVHGYHNVLDAQGTKVVIGGFDKSGTQLWDTATDAVTRSPSGTAPGRSLAQPAGELHQGPLRRRLHRAELDQQPGTRLWESCGEAITNSRRTVHTSPPSTS